ncbi:ATP-binding cassette domain-containing protein [Aeromicrobium fastidiosum]|uniref:energy-coupling factor ABC transporter ATP-binding protein n=1 Tax=Aeromicrobium fastidiosum TaxID=52699 RepID=UPI0020233FCB|nr:ATP-binding cassette domain-containing protein [Aeromicrobium fastidiosum]MCL8252941.1 ATP-binding cassette domain-containing protein [Aeromicrobium fastidiosum]
MSHRSLRADGLTVTYTGGPPVLEGASIEVAPATRLAVLGANGSGKTTLLRCLAGSLVPTSGHVLLDDVPIRHDRKGLRRHRQEVQLVLQDPDDQLFSADVFQDVSFGPVNLGLDAAEVRARVDEALALLGIEHLRRRPTHQLSYGERKRVATAGAVAMRPCVLLLDEPTAGLDPAAVDELMAALTRLEEHETTVVLSTHDVSLALSWADSVAVAHDRVVVQGDPVDLLGDAALLAAARLRLPWSLDLSRRLAADGLVADGTRARSLDEIHRALRDHTTDRPFVKENA